MTTKPLPCNLKARNRATGCDPPLIVEALSDAETRELFAAFEEPTTAPEVAAERDVPTSTVYRKLDALEDAGLIVPVGESASRATRYVKAMDCISITYDDPLRIECVKNGVALYCEV